MASKFYCEFSVRIINLNSFAKKPERSEGKKRAAGENFFDICEALFIFCDSFNDKMQIM